MYSRGFFREHSVLLLSIYRLLDVSIFLAICVAAYFVVFGIVPLRPDYEVAVTLAVLIFLAVFQTSNIYRAWRGEEFTAEVASLFVSWNIVFAILIFSAAITKTTADFSRAWLLMWYTGGFTALFVQRLCLRKVLRFVRSKGFNLRHIIIIGSGKTGLDVLKRIRETTDSGLNVKAYFGDRIGDSQSATICRPVSDLPDFLLENKIDQVWIAMSLKESEAIEKILNSLTDLTCDIRLIPDLFGFHLINHSVSSVAGLPVINLSVTPMDGLNRWIKALEDKLFSLLILIIASPLILLISLIIKMSTEGPIFYIQERVSWNGRRFNMYKFRTMPVGIEQTSGPVWASRGESRATRIGRILRRTSLDELPQFWNVLKGDMSIVGPRPERPVFVEKFRDEIPGYMQKHMVKAGITGWAQINGWRGDTDLKTRVEHDLYYIDNWSLWLDLKIILLTIFRGFFHPHAY